MVALLKCICNIFDGSFSWLCIISITPIVFNVMKTLHSRFAQYFEKYKLSGVVISKNLRDLPVIYVNDKT